VPARVGVVTFPGSLDDRDAQRAVRIAGGDAVPLWHADPVLPDVDAVILPGGFSYGDYLRCGAIARFAPVMEAVIAAARDGLPVLGICNGFQVLCEAHLLPGALVRNNHRRFVCRDQRLIVENVVTVWTQGYRPGAEIVIPIKNGEGGYVADERTLNELEASGRVAAARTAASAISPAFATRWGMSWASCRTPSTRSTDSPARASTACLSSPGWPDRRV
jgi:phosphoribosylformylglycinamidine synthase I